MDENMYTYATGASMHWNSIICNGQECILQDQRCSAPASKHTCMYILTYTDLELQSENAQACAVHVNVLSLVDCFLGFWTCLWTMHELCKFAI